MRRFNQDGKPEDVSVKASSCNGFNPVELGGGGTLSSSIKAFFGYTLAEIIVVMLIIAVIVAVTIGVTKHKLDNIVTYTYYSAYSTLRTATSQILADYNPTDERYQAKAEEPSLLAKVQTFFESNFGVLAANAIQINDWQTGVDTNPNYGIVGGGSCGMNSDPLSCREDGCRWCMGTNKCISSSLNCDSCSANEVECKKLDPGSREIPRSDGIGYLYCCPKKSGGGSGSSIPSVCPENYMSCLCTAPGAVNMGAYKGCCCPTGAPDVEQPDFTCSESLYCPSDATAKEVNGNCACVCNKPNMTFNKDSWQCEYQCSGEQPPCATCSLGMWVSFQCISGTHLDESTCKCVPDESTPPSTPDCLGGKIWNGSSCVCPDGQIDQGGTCVDDPSDDCTGGQVWNGSSCECPSGQIWDGSECKTDIDCSGEAPCGKQCDRTTGGWVDIPGFSRECNAEQNQIWSEAQCRCIPSSRTISTNGQKYCEYLSELFNTKSTVESCNGVAIGANETSFSGKTPDITLRNGMRMYNVRQPYAMLPDLANNIEGGKIEQEDGSIIDTNAYGYTVYIDIDGEKGGSEKWVDVYPFYVTLSGMVIPGYDKDHPGEYGGDSRNHMQVSIEDEVIEGGRRKIKWLAKSVSYKEAACGAGYIGANTPYCREGHASVYNNECSNDNSLCRLKYIKPVKFLF